MRHCYLILVPFDYKIALIYYDNTLSVFICRLICITILYEKYKNNVLFKKHTDIQTACNASLHWAQRASLITSNAPTIVENAGIKCHL